MRFLTIYTADATRTKHNESDAPPDPAEIARTKALIAKMTADGTLISTEGCKCSAHGARVRQTQGKVTVTDGPFTESKELIAGFAIINAKSKADAIAMTKTFLGVAGDGVVEVRELFSESDFRAAMY
jgi:hypothetical protein